MAMPVRRSAETVGRLGDEIYDRDFRTQVEATCHGKIVAIDVDSGDFEIGGRYMEGLDNLLKRRPNPSLWTERVGYDTPLIYDPNDYHFRLFGTPVEEESKIG